MSRRSRGKSVNRAVNTARIELRPVPRLKPLSACIRHACLPAGLLLSLGLSPVLAGPEGGQVVGGQGNISKPDSSTTNIKQNSHNLAIDWQSFNVGKNEAVNFHQPSKNATALNRIYDQNPSQIFGQINANGNVILANPNGMIFGPSAQVNVNSLIGAGHDISVQDFMSGQWRFKTPEGTEAGQVINYGLLEAATGGSISLLGGSVRNEGTILATAGQVNMAAGEQITMDFDGDGLMQFTVDKAVLSNAQDLDGAVVNTGEIAANGGYVTMSGKVAQNVFSHVVNNEGVIRASRIENQGGKIVLGGSGGSQSSVINNGVVDASAAPSPSTGEGGDGGEIHIIADTIEQQGTIRADSTGGNGGTIKLVAEDTNISSGDAVISATSISPLPLGEGQGEGDDNSSPPLPLGEGQGEGGQGGTVHVLGDKVALLDNSAIDVSGELGGGEALVGGDIQGLNPEVKNASAVFLGENTAVRVDAIRDGDGGKLVVFAEKSAKIAADLSARGGAEGGNGGFIETSGKQSFVITKTPDITAPAGNAGQWLIDPYNITIVAGGGNTNINTASPFDPTGNDAQLGVDLITAALTGGATVTVTTGADGAQDGNITLDTTLDYNSTGTNTLILDAANNILITDANGVITDSVAGGDVLNLQLIAAGGSIDINGNVNLNGGSFTATSAGIFDTDTTAVITAGVGNITTTNSTVFISDDATFTGGLTGNSGTGVFNVDDGATLTLAADSSITAGNLTIDQVPDSFINATGVQLTITAANDANISLGAAAGGLEISNDELTDITAGTLRLVTTGAGNITVDGVTAASTANIAGLTTLDAGTDISFVTGASTFTNALTANADNDISSAVGVTVNTGTLTFTADADISGVGTLTATTIDLDAATGITASTAATTVTADNTTINDVSVTDADGVTITGSNAGGGSFTAISGGGGTLTVGAGNITANTGSVTLQADEVDLTAATSVTGDGGVQLRPNTATTAITLGAGTGGLNFTDASLDKIFTTGTLTIGATTAPAAGAITIDAAIDPANASNLQLLSAGNIIFAQAAGVTALTKAGGTVTLNTTAGAIQGTANLATDISATSVVLTGNQGVGSTNAIETVTSNLTVNNTGAGVANNIQIDNTGSLNLGAGGTVTNGAATGDIDVEVLGAGNDLTISNTVTAGRNVLLTADDDIIFTQALATTGVSAGTRATLTAGSGSLDGLIVGNANTANDINAANIELVADTGIGNTDEIEINATDATNGLAATTASGDINIVDTTGGLNIGTVNATTGLTITAGALGDDIRVRALSPVTVNSDVTNTGGGNITIAAEGSADADDLTIAANITATGGDGSIALYAGDDILHTSGTVSVVNNGTITYNAGVDFNDGMALMEGFASGSIVQSGGLIQSANAATTLRAAEDIAISDVRATNSNVNITANDLFGVVVTENNMGAISEQGVADATADITALTATLSAATGIGSAGAIETNITTLDALNTTSGGIQIFEVTAGAALDINQANAQGAGNIDVQTQDGTLTVVAGQNGVAAAGAGTITLIAGDAGATNDDNLVVNHTINAATGKVTLTSATNDVTFGAGDDVTTTSGEIEVNAGAAGVGLITMADGTVFNAGDDLINLNGVGDVTIGRLITTNATATAVEITSTAGAIIDGGDTGGSDVDAANGGLVIDAVTGVGTSLNAIETTVASIDIDNSTSGDVNINETDALDITRINIAAGTGTVNVDAGGTITVTAAGTGITTQGGQIELDANGAASSIAVNDAITSNGGAVNVLADDDVTFAATGSISSGNGAVIITANADNGGVASGAVTMTDGATVNAGTNTIAVSADENITLGRLVTTNATTTAVTLTSTEGGIVDGGDTGGADVEATTGGLVIDAVSGVGNGNAIETTVASVDIDNATSGNIEITETDGLTVIKAVQATDDDANDISITSTTGDIEIDTISTGGTAGDVTLNAVAGAITDANTNSTITADVLTIDAVTGVGDIAGNPINTAVNFLDIDNITSGDIDISETNAVTITKAANSGLNAGDDVRIVTTTAGDMTVADVSVVGNGTAANSQITLTTNDGAILDDGDNGTTNISAGAAGVTINLTAGGGANDDIGANSGGGTPPLNYLDISATFAPKINPVVTAGQDVFINLLNADVRSSDFAGAKAALSAADIVGLHASGGNFIFDDTTFNALTGSLLNIGANNNINFTVAGPEISATNNVTLNAITGSITDNDASVDIAGAALTLDAATGISVDTTVVSVNASVTGAGSIDINEADAITLTDVDTANGAITITSGGAMVATDVQSSTDDDANDISLTATTGTLTVGTVTIGAGGVDAAAGDVSLTATAGSIIDDANDAVTDVTGEVVTLTAGTGVGEAAGNGSLDTRAVSLDVSVTGAGLINLAELNAVTLTDVDTANGAITITSGGAMVATDVQSSTDNDANDISLTGVGIAAGVVNAGAMAGDVTLNAGTGAITDNNAGTNNITADVLTADATTGIDLDTTVLSIDIDNLTSGNVDIAGTNALSITKLNQQSTGTISVAAVGITQAGAITQVAAGGAVTINGGAGVITLDDATNEFTGTVNLSNSGANAVRVDDANSLIIGTINVGQNLTLNIDRGAVDDVATLDLSGAALTVGGTSTVNGNGTNDSLVGTNTVNTWTITALDTGSLNNSAEVISFNDFGNLTGNANTDNFVFTGGSLSGNVDGQAGANTLDYSALAGPISVTLNGLGGTTGFSGGAGGASQIGGTFDDITNLVGSAAAGSGAAGDTLTGRNATAAFEVDGGNRYCDGGVACAGNTLGFSGIENLTGGSNVDTFNIDQNHTGDLRGGAGADTFTFSTGNVLTGLIDGSTGSDTLDWSSTITTPVTVTLTNQGSVDGFEGTATGITGSFDNIDAVEGDAGEVNTLQSNIAGAATWTITADSVGIYQNVNTLNFIEFSNLSGGGGADIFDVNAGHTGDLSGSGGADIFNLSASVNGNVDGGADNDTFNLDTAGLNIGGDIIGGAGTDEIVASTTATTFTITSNGAGTVNDGVSKDFSTVENLTGGTAGDTFDVNANHSGDLTGNAGNDQFNFTATLTGDALGGAGDDTFDRNGAGSVNGLIDGGANNDTYDVSGATGNVTLTLGSGFADIQSLLGSSDTLIGRSNATNEWDLTGADSGTIETATDGIVNFDGFNTVRSSSGGSNIFTANGNYNGTVNLLGLNNRWNHTAGATLTNGAVSGTGSLTIPGTAGADMTIGAGDLVLPNISGLTGPVFIGGTVSAATTPLNGSQTVDVFTNILSVASTITTGGDLVLLGSQIDLNTATMNVGNEVNLVAVGTGCDVCQPGFTGSGNVEVNTPITVNANSGTIIAAGGIQNSNDLTLDFGGGDFQLAVSPEQQVTSNPNPKSNASGVELTPNIQDFINDVLGLNVVATVVTFFNPALQLFALDDVSFVDAGLFAEDLTLFGVIGEGIALSLAQCEEVEGCAPNVTTEELEILIQGLEARIEELEKKIEETADPAEREELESLLAGFREELENFEGYREELRQFLEGPIEGDDLGDGLDDELDFGDEDFDETPGTPRAPRAAPEDLGSVDTLAKMLSVINDRIDFLESLRTDTDRRAELSERTGIELTPESLDRIIENTRKQVEFIESLIESLMEGSQTQSSEVFSADAGSPQSALPSIGYNSVDLMLRNGGLPMDTRWF